MELHELARIALFLNCATSKVSSERSLEWLTVNKAACNWRSGGNQETQCLTFGATLWIANNEDDDTALQKEMLQTLGINSITNWRSS